MMTLAPGIRANPSVGTTGFTSGINSAILRYSGADDSEPSTIQNTEASVLDEADLAPLVDPAAVSEPYAIGVCRVRSPNPNRIAR